MKLSEQDFRDAAARIGCSVAALKAVVDVECRGNGFVRHRGTLVPVILFEAHWFYKLSGPHPASRVAPHLSSPRWNRRLYNRAGRPVRSGEDRQHVRLEEAVALDDHFGASGAVRDAALMSCSWGIGQVMGFHWRALGYDSLQAFVNAMYVDEGSQLDAMARFIIRNRLADELRRLDWHGFARGYNGSGYRLNRYHTKLARAHARHS